MVQLLPGHASRIKGQHPFPRRLLAIVLGLLVLHDPSSAFEADRERSVQVLQVLSGDSLLVEGHREVRLSFISAPMSPPDLGELQPWPPAEAARLALLQLVENRRVSPYPTSGNADRYGRQTSLVYLPDGALLQTALLRAGHARIVSLPTDENLWRKLLDAEREARAVRRGLWDHPYYRVRPAHPNRLETGRYQLAIGRLVSANRVRSGAYLNFGRSWKSDVTVKLDRMSAEGFEQRYGEVEALAGRLVLVRGWVIDNDGPLFQIDDHRFVEILD